MGAHIVQIVFGLPAQQTLCLFCAGKAGGNIAGAAGGDLQRNDETAGLFKGVNHVQNAAALAGAQVDGFCTGVVQGIIHGLNMAQGQVYHMEIIPNAGAVGGGIVIAVDGQMIPLTDGNLGDIGHQVVGNAVGCFADQARGMGANGIEVPKQYGRQLLVCLAGIGENLLDHQLGGAVGVGGGAGGHILGEGGLIVFSIHRCRGGEHNGLAAELLHDLQSGQGGVQIVPVVFQRELGALGDALEAGEMDHRVDLILLKQLGHSGLVGSVDLIELRPGAGNGFDAVNNLGAGVGKIVGDDNVVSGVDHLHRRVGTDKTGSACE